MKHRHPISPHARLNVPCRVPALGAAVSVMLLSGCSPGDAPAGVRRSAIGTTYTVGPGKAYPDLKSVAGLLSPGDVVEVYAKGSAYDSVRFDRPGTKAARITIRGIRTGGQRPVISGGANTVEFLGDHYVFEGFDATGGSSRVLYHHADDITIRDTVVHDCPSHGILGADTDSGSLTIEYVEVYRCGAGDRKHPIYVTSDQLAHPGSVFRMQHCYVHDGNGGNNVKSRAERNEIYYNWIEGGFYRELELIAPEDPAYNKVREDSDVVGNVFVKKNGSYVARIGGDGGGGESRGRYRFVNNVFVLQPGSGPVIQAYDKLQTLEMHNNVFYRIGGGGVAVLKDVDATWVTGGRVISGQNNWLQSGSSAVPTQFTGSVTGGDPGFQDVGSLDVRPTAAAALVNAGTGSPQSPAGYDFPSPLRLPLMLPPLHTIEAVDGAQARPMDGKIDIGAYENGMGMGLGPDLAPGGGGPDLTPGPGPDLAPGGGGPDGGGGAGCITGTGNQSFPSQGGTFTAEADVTPSGSAVDSAVALSLGAASKWRALAAIVLFSSSGVIQARNGGSYQAAAAIPYAGGTTYHVRLAADVGGHTYSIYVTPAGGSEQLLGSGYAFRTEQAGVAALDTWDVMDDSGSLQACNLSVH